MRKITIGNYEIPKALADKFRAFVHDLGFHEASVTPALCGHYEVAFYLRFIENLRL